MWYFEVDLWVDEMVINRHCRPVLVQICLCVMYSMSSFYFRVIKCVYNVHQRLNYPHIYNDLKTAQDLTITIVPIH